MNNNDVPVCFIIRLWELIYKELPVRVWLRKLHGGINSKNFWGKKMKIWFYCSLACTWCEYTCEIWKIPIIFRGREGAVKRRRAHVSAGLREKVGRSPSTKKTKANQALKGGTNWSWTGTNAPTWVLLIQWGSAFTPNSSLFTSAPFCLPHDQLPNGPPFQHHRPHVGFKAHL